MMPHRARYTRCARFGACRFWRVTCATCGHASEWRDRLTMALADVDGHAHD